MTRIGFEVPEWTNRPFGSFTMEELLEYWFLLRRFSKSGPVDTSDYSRKGLDTDLYIVGLQQEILDRIKGPIKEIENLRELVWEEDIPQPTVPEYVEHHKSIQKILNFIDTKLLKEVRK